MKDIIITIIFILLILTAIASAYAQEEWFEVAESSGVGYENEIRHSKKTVKKEVEIDGRILREIESFPVTSQFVARNFGAGGCAPAGRRGAARPSNI